MRRVAVVGPAGSGKTTLAANLARRLGAPHIELDAVFWGPGWQAAARDDFRARVAERLAGDAWTTDGNYGSARDVIWSRADTLVWLDYGLMVIVGRLLWRTLVRIVRRQELWNGNRETLIDHLREPLLPMAVREHFRMRRTIPALLALPEYRHLRLIRLRSPREAEAWLRDVAGRPEPVR